ncbi:MAG TPA: hypothetical protein VFQ71_13735 [Gaiellales bacterium]|jgi:hypothetical protein|nr:hypothetical protein [Gaiellales bacterium]
MGLLAARERELRLTPDRALTDLAEAAAWIGERGMATTTDDCSLPSLFAACHEPPYQPGGRGFASWPATKHGWPLELSAAGTGIHSLAIHRGKRLLVSSAVAQLVDPLARAALAEAAGQPLLRHLESAGPSLVDDLQVELGLDAAALRRTRRPLERVGALVSRSVTVATAGGGHRHTSELMRWDQAFPAPAAGTGGLAELLVAGVRAAVLAPPDELRRWFSWPVPAGLVDQLVERGLLARSLDPPGLVAGPRVG